MEKISSIARRLEVPATGREVSARRLPSGEVPIYLGKDAAGHLHLLVPLGKRRTPGWIAGLSAQSIRTKIRELRIGTSLPQRFIDVHFADDEHSALAAPFLGFGEDFIDRVRQSPIDVLGTLRETFEQWKRFWASEQQPYSPEWTRGLFGELVFLKLAIEKTGPSCVDAWRGPDAPQDFAGGTVAFEVKATLSLPHSPMISSIDQLDHAPFNSLFLVCVLLESTSDGATLPQLVGGVRSILGDYGPKLRQFEETLGSFGYQEMRARQYCTTQYNPLTVDVFRCDDSFPALRRSELRQPLDGRVTRVTYRVSLTGIAAKSVEDPEVLSALDELHGG